MVLQNFEEYFDYLYENFGLSMALKVHIILHHYATYFETMGKTFKDTNGEFVESLHNSLRRHEEIHKFKVVNKLGSAGHIKKSLGSISTFNTMKAGFIPATEFTIRRKSSPHQSYQ